MWQPVDGVAQLVDRERQNLDGPWQTVRDH
jgi:hypothetical protein